MRWVSSSSSDVLSFYSLPDGVQHVLPTVLDVCHGKPTWCTTSGSDGVRSGQHDRVQNDGVELRRGASSNIGIKQNCQQMGSACTGLSALRPGASPAVASISNHDIQASRQSSHAEGPVSAKYSADTHSSKSYHIDFIPQQSLGYVTTCVFSGGWGGYDETEVTVGTTEGYVYALPALWPPPSPVSCEKAGRGKEGGSLSICLKCRSAVPSHRVTVDEGEWATFLCGACKAAVGDRGFAAENGTARRDELEETYSLTFPTSYVAAPVKRLLRLPYTVQHLQMLGSHTPALADEYHDELLWLQREQRRHRTPVPRAHGSETQSAEQLETGKRHRCVGARCSSRNQENRYESPSQLDSGSCCCGKGALLSSCTADQLCCFHNISLPDRSARSSASPALHTLPHASQRSRDLASRVKQFFSSDRLLLALDKGGNGVVAHWPAPPYLHDWLPPTVASTHRDQARCSGNSTRCGNGPREIAVPLAASFSLNLSLQCCASNPVITSLLAVVPCVVAAGGLRLLSVYDLVTSSFVFYARPPILRPDFSLGRVHAEQQQYHCHYPSRAPTEDAWPRPRSPGRRTGLVWPNTCCLSRSPSTPADSTQPAGGASGPGVCKPYATGTSGAGLQPASSAVTAKNIPISVSSLTWLPALHPLLLGASTDSGLLLLYDLRVSPHPVFCGTRPHSAYVGKSGAMTPARSRSARVQAPSNPDCFRGGKREMCKVKHGITEATSSETPRGVVEPASSTGVIPSAAIDNSMNESSSKEIGDRPLAGLLKDRKDVRRGSRLDVRSSGKKDDSSNEGLRPERRLRRSNSRCPGETRGKRYLKHRRKDGKHAKEKSMRISFLTSPAWLTSAAVSHDAAILPCGCRCCRARAAEFSKTDAPCSMQKGISTAPFVAKPHRPELVQSDPISFLKGNADFAQKHGFSRSGGLTSEHSRHNTLSCTQSEKQLDQAAEAEDDDVDRGETSVFGGCAATVIIKPRNSTRPRPRLRRQTTNAKRTAFQSVPGRWSTGKLTPGRTSSNEKIPTGQHYCRNNFPEDGIFCKGCSLLGGAVSAALSTQNCRNAAGDMSRLKRRTCQLGHDVSWRRRWLARQERALVNFFTETYTTLLSSGLGMDKSVVATSMEAETSTPTTGASPPTFSGSGQDSTTRPPASGGPKYAVSPPNPLGGNDAVEDRGRKRRFESVCNSPGVSSCASSSIHSGNAHVQTTKAVDVGALSAVSCVSGTVASDLRGRFPHSARCSVSCVTHMPSSYVLAGTSTSIELPFNLLRLASLPCSVLAGFPSTGWGSKVKTFAQSACSSEREHLRLLSDITIPFIASCFFALFARLLYAHRLDQHAVARRLSYHEERQLLKLLHAADCPESAFLSEELLPTDAAITAVNAAEIAAAEAHLAEADARAAGLAGATPASVAPVVSSRVEPDVLEKLDARIILPSNDGSAQRKPLHVEGRPEASGHAVGGASGIVQGMSVSVVCSSSRTFPAPPVSKTVGAPETTSPLINFKNKLLSFYSNAVLVERKGRPVQRKLVPPIHDSIERALPDMFSRHAQNCMQLLRYASAVLYAFGDAAPVLARKSAAAGKAVQAAAACAVGLELEKPLFSQLKSASISPGFWTDGYSAQAVSPAGIAARDVRLAASKEDGVGVHHPEGEEEGNIDNELRCGCGRVEAAIKAKMRRWIADEFITDVRPAMKDLPTECSTSLLGTERTSFSPLTHEKGPCQEEKDRVSAQECAAVRHVVAAIPLVASSICFCESFQSATFFPILFFNVFRRLFARTSETPFCIQRNCIRYLPVSDVSYQKLARSQLRTLTRNYCGSQRATPAQSAVGKTGRGPSDVYGVPLGEVNAAATSAASSINCSEVACCGSCGRATKRAKCTDAEKHVGGSIPPSRERTDSRQVKDHMRTQQLFCLDDRGRVRVLSISLRLPAFKANVPDNNADGRTKPANSNVPHADNSRNLDYASDGDKEHCQEDIYRCLPHEQKEIRSQAFPGAPIQSHGDNKEQKGNPASICKDTHSQASNPAECSGQSAYSTAGANVITSEQTASGCSHLLQHSEPSLNSGMGEHLLRGLQGYKELLPIDRDEQEYFCMSEPESAVHSCRLHRKMWKEQWLRGRRCSEWCSACMPVITGTSCVHPSGKTLCDLKTVNLESGSTPHAETSCVTDDVSTGVAGNLTASEAHRKATLSRTRPRVRTRGSGRMKQGGKHSGRLLNNAEKLALTGRIARTVATARLAQVHANLSLLRLFPLLPLWINLKPRRLWRLSSELHRGRCTPDGLPFCLSPTKTCSCGIRKDTQPEAESGLGYASGHQESRKISSSATNSVADVLTDAARSNCAIPKESLVAQRSDTVAAKSDEEDGRLATPVATRRESEIPACGRTGNEECRECCREICCNFQVEEEACFEVNGITNCGHFERDSRRSRVMSLAIHENGKYVLAATCAPSFLLYSSSSKDPLPPYERKDRLLFGCAAGSVPHSRTFRLLSNPHGAHFSPAGPLCSSFRSMPAFHLPGLPSGPRPPPPLLISASPILPPAASAPFLPHTLLRRHADHDVAYGVTCDPATLMRRRARCRPRMSAFLKRKNADAGCGLGGIRREAVFSDWLTDEEDERELHGDASGSEAENVSDS